jgi:hypothetical protein
MKPNRKLNRIAPLVALLLSFVHCEPFDEAPPPEVPRQPTGIDAVPPPDPPPSPSAEGTATDSASGADEYTLGASANDEYDDDDPAALADFRASLEPHGTWTDDPTYGTVWAPSEAAAGPDFTPYVSGGHWAYDNDWVWVSDYEWGWAPFHYGRWVWLGGRGWAWIPGRAYRGAWVTWGVDDEYGYVGWAPLAPAFVWFGGVAVAFPGHVGPPWVYCRRGDVFSPTLRGRVVAGAAAGPIAMRVRPYVPATPGVAGPSPQKLGFQSVQIPRAAASSSPGVARAQQFARPSTAQALGARAPVRVTPAPPSVLQGRQGLATSLPASPTVRPGHVPAGSFPPAVSTPGRSPPAAMPGVVRPPPAAVMVRPPAPVVRAPAPVLAPRATFRGGGGTFHGGGGGHHR